MKDVQRLSGTPKNESYNLLEHSSGVLFIFLQLCKERGLTVTGEDAEVVLMHDILETQTGDLLYDAKNLNSLTREYWRGIEDHVLSNFPHLDRYCDANIERTLGSEKFELFKQADLLELFLFCSRQKVLGNKSERNQLVIDNCKELLSKQEGEYLQNIIIYGCEG